MVIYKISDRIPVEVGGLKFWLSPLTYAQRIEIADATKMQSGVEIADTRLIAFLSIKFSVKEVEGLKNADGSDYILSVDSNGSLSDECVSDLMNLDLCPKIVSAASALMREIKEHEIEGVKIDLKGVKDSKKKG